MKSYAEKKFRWKGEKGSFKKKDLQKWFKVYDETKLYQLRKKIDKDVKEQNEAHEIGNVNGYH